MDSVPRTSWPLSWIGRWHHTLVFQRRTRVLASLLAAEIPQRAALLDIGCGDGTVAHLISQIRPDIAVEGVELQVRASCKIRCRSFDGKKLPFADGSFDACLFVDVLHHTQDPAILLREAVRVSRAAVLIKDHLDENLLDHFTLRFMDWVGNRPHGVVLTYNYLSGEKWKQLFLTCGLTQVNWTSRVPLYPAPFSLLLGRRLHFVAQLKKAN